jgi:hypothetical protein
MKERGTFLQGLRTRRVASFVALYALLIEIFIGAMHSAALAASAFGPPVNPDSFLFQICTPSGITSIRVAGDESGTPAQKGSRGSASDFCPVCGSTAVSLFTYAPPAAVPPAPQAVFSRIKPEDRSGRSLTAWRSRRIRAPPA